MTNQWIGERLKSLHKTKGAMARALGIDPARVSEIIGGRRNVQVAELPVMAEILEIPTEELVGRLVSRRHRSRKDGGGGASFQLAEPPAGDGFVARAVELPARAQLRRDLPIYGSAMGGSDGAFEMNGQVMDYAERPPGLAGARNAYGIYVQGDSMSPRFETGWLVLVNPSRPVRRGDNVVIQLKPRDEHSAPLAFLKVFESRSASTLTARQFNPPRSLEWPNELVVSVHRVVGVADI